MKTCKSLPFAVPMFGTYHGSAIVGLGLSMHPSGETLLLNRATTLLCERKFVRGYTSPQVTVLGTMLSRFPELTRDIMVLKYIKEQCHEIIHRVINDDAYAHISGFDDYYLPEKSWYGIRHMEHDGIICGYDDENRTYDLAAYDIDWNFRIIKISWESFEESMNKALEQNFSPRIIAVKPNDFSAELDIELICSGLKQYIGSTLDKYPPEKDGRALGIIVNDYMAIYMDKLLDGSIPHEKIDWRAMRPIWEFRVCMLKRIQAVENKLNMSTSVSEKYATVTDETNRLRMFYAVYSKKKKDSLAVYIKNEILRLKENEKALIQEFIEKTEEAMGI